MAVEPRRFSFVTEIKHLGVGSRSLDSGTGFLTPVLWCLILTASVAALLRVFSRPGSLRVLWRFLAVAGHGLGRLEWENSMALGLLVFSI